MPKSDSTLTSVTIKPSVLTWTSDRKHSKTVTSVLLSIALAVTTLAVYAQVLNHEFLSFDDYSYVTENPHVTSGLNTNNIVWAFTSVEQANWHPLTWLSHMTDVQLFGLTPMGHHITNVVIHTFSTVLFFILLVRLTGKLWQSLFVAALFSFHPLHVESVAWVAERKDLLSTFFCFLSLLLYCSYVTKQKILPYLLSILFFMFALMSKPMAVTLPIIMLLIDFWPLNRFRNWKQMHVLLQDKFSPAKLVQEKMPFLVCSLFSSLITIYAQSKGGAITGYNLMPLWLRIENALTAYVRYIGKTLWPHDLAVLYPFPSSVPIWQSTGSILILVLVTAVVLSVRNRYPYLTVGWFWFLITLVPVIGVIQVGSQSMADRYMYFPSIGLFVMAAWWIPELISEWQFRKTILAILFVAIIIGSAFLTGKQLAYWRDKISLYTHTLEITNDNWLINTNLGLAFQERGNLDAAIDQYQKALKANPFYVVAHTNLGTVFQAKGDLYSAKEQYLEALRINPSYAGAHNNLGIIFTILGDYDSAITEFEKARGLTQDDSHLHNNLGYALLKRGDLEFAIQSFQEALRINPKNEKAILNMKSSVEQKRVQENTKNIIKQ